MEKTKIKKKFKKITIDENDPFKKVCRDFMTKECNRKECKYIHDHNLCLKFWKNWNLKGVGSCKWKNNCRKRHELTLNDIHNIY